MSDVSKAVAADNTALDETRAFINITKKKKSPSKSDGTRFSELWAGCVAESGVNEQTLSLLCDGFRYSNARPLHTYCMSEGSKPFPYSTLRSYRCVRDSVNDIELRLYISLFALELIRPTSNNQLSWLMKSIPQAAINKEGKINGNLHTYLRKLVLEEIEGESLPSKFEQNHSTGRDFTLFANLLSSELQTLIGGLKEPGLKAAAQSLIKWLDGDKITAEQEASAKIERPETETDPNNDDGNRTASTNLNGSSAKNETMKNSSGDPIGYEDVIAFVRHQQRSLESARESLATSEISAARSKEERDSVRLRAVDLENKLDEALMRISVLDNEVVALKEAHKAAIEESAAKEELLTLSNKTRVKQTDEATKRVAKKLSIEYRDFRDAIELDMDVDLGENMRLQLESVFDILIDAGFEL